MDGDHNIKTRADIFSIVLDCIKYCSNNFDHLFNIFFYCDKCIIKVMLLVYLNENDVVPITTYHFNSYEKYCIFNITLSFINYYRPAKLPAFGQTLMNT